MGRIDRPGDVDPQMELVKRFRLEAAHRVPTADDERERRVHGHSFVIEVVVRGEVDERSGWVIDFAEIKRAFAPIHRRLDHRYFNQIQDLAVPTAGRVARWIYERMHPSLPLLHRVIVRETDRIQGSYPPDRGR